METKGIIISQKEYERLTELEKNFDNRIKENKETFKKGLEDAIKGNLVKVLWINDKYYADLMGCDLSNEGIDKFIRREDADFVDSVSANGYYDRDKLVNEHKDKRVPQELINECEDAYKKQIVVTAKRTIRNLWLTLGIMFVAWVVQLIAYITK